MPTFHFSFPSMLASDYQNAWAFLLILPCVALSHLISAVHLNIDRTLISRVFGGVAILVSGVFLLTIAGARDVMMQMTLTLGVVGGLFGLFFVLAKRTGTWKEDAVMNCVGIGCAAAPWVITGVVATDSRFLQRTITPFLELSLYGSLEILSITMGLLQWPMYGYFIGRIVRSHRSVLKCPEFWILIVLNFTLAIFATNTWH